MLLSIQQACKYKGVSFLKFLLSGQTDIDEFRWHRRRWEVSALELYPEGSEADRPGRKRIGGCPAGANGKAPSEPGSTAGG